MTLRRIASVIAVFATVCSLAHGAVYYVTPGGSGLKNGSSWSDAFDNIQAAIDSCATVVPGAFRQPDQVWLSGGTYTPRSTVGSRKSALYVPGDKNVEIYGGFAGFETRLTDHSPAQHPTIIDGSIANGGLPAWHVIQLSGVRPEEGRQMIDGLIVTGGRADMGTTNTSLEDNGGGGVFLYPSHTERKVLVRNCIIAGNVAKSFGAGLYSALSFEAVNCLFAGNCVGSGAEWNATLPALPAYGGGGACAKGDVDSTFDHCSFINNYHPLRASALLNYTGTLMVVRNCMFEGNRVYRSTDIYSAALVAEGVLTPGSLSLRNCLFNHNIDSSMSARDLYYPRARNEYTGGAAINSIVADRPAEDIKLNLGGIEGERAVFQQAYSNFWISDPVYASSTGKTRITSAAEMEGGIGPGALIEVASGSSFGNRLAVVTDVQGDQVELAGDWSATAPLPQAQSGGSFRVMDYRPVATSAAVDHGENAAPPIVFSAEPSGVVYGQDEQVGLGAELVLTAEYSIGFKGTTDLDGSSRMRDGDLNGVIVADIGAFEYQAGQSEIVRLRWLKNSLPLDDGSRVSGATTTCLRISNISPEDAGSYTCMIQYGGTSAVSRAAELLYKPGSSGISDWYEQ